jgi:hypothetical protein
MATDAYPPDKQRPALLKFAAALGCRDNAVRRDECGDWRIEGAQGHIYAVPGGFQIFVLGWSARGWNGAKQALGFAKLCNVGDDEGALLLDRLPTAEEAKAIRHWCGIAKKAEFSDEVMARKREQALRARQLIGHRPALDALPGHGATLEAERQ